MRRKRTVLIERISAADLVAAFEAARMGKIRIHKVVRPRADVAPRKPIISAPARPIGELSPETRAEVDRILAQRAGRSR